MKLNNFTSLDPEELARGIKGLSGASKLDRDVWNDLHRDQSSQLKNQGFQSGAIAGRIGIVSS